MKPFILQCAEAPIDRQAALKHDVIKCFKKKYQYKEQFFIMLISLLIMYYF